MLRKAHTSPKLKRLKRRLQIPQYQAVGILESLWHMTATQAPRGDIGKWSDEDIAAQLEWVADESILIDALVGCGWLDRDPNHRLLVHDWAVHADKNVRTSPQVKECGFAVPTPETPPEHPCSTPETQVGHPCSTPDPPDKPVPEPEPEPVPAPVPAPEAGPEPKEGEEEVTGDYHSSSSSIAALKTYLGDHAHVADAATGVLGGSSWPYAVLGWFGASGTRQRDYGDTPKTDRPRVLATALLALISSSHPRMHQSSLAAMVRTAARDLSRPLPSERTGEYIAPGKYTDPPDEPMTEEGRAELGKLMAETREMLGGASATPEVEDEERAREVEARREGQKAQLRQMRAGQAAPGGVAP